MDAFPCSNDGNERKSSASINCEIKTMEHLLDSILRSNVFNCLWWATWSLLTCHNISIDQLIINYFCIYLAQQMTLADGMFFVLPIFCWYPVKTYKMFRHLNEISPWIWIAGVELLVSAFICFSSKFLIAPHTLYHIISVDSIRCFHFFAVHVWAAF